MFEKIYNVMNRKIKVLSSIGLLLSIKSADIVL